METSDSLPDPSARLTAAQVLAGTGSTSGSAESGMVYVMAAYQKGAAIERRDRRSGPNNSAVWVTCLQPKWNWEVNEYRITPPTPAPAFRTYTLAEIPVGAIVRRIGFRSGARTMIVAATPSVDGHGIAVVFEGRDYTHLSASSLLLRYERQSNDGGGWEPCGVKNV